MPGSDSDILVNVATPPLTVALTVPPSVPAGPEAIVRVTLEKLSLVTTFPLAASTLTAMAG